MPRETWARFGDALREIDPALEERARRALGGLVEAQEALAALQAEPDRTEWERGLDEELRAAAVEHAAQVFGTARAPSIPAKPTSPPLPAPPRTRQSG